MVPPPTVCGPGGTVACCGMPAFAPLLHLAKFYLSFLFFRPAQFSSYSQQSVLLLGPWPTQQAWS